MRKPILTIKVPGYMPQDDLDDIQTAMDYHLEGDYHVIVYTIEDQNDTEFKVLNAEQLTEETAAKLMRLV
jgi:hypothetical protein